jgi:raffinose/stachyose/melibiose transport system permease protein
VAPALLMYTAFVIGPVGYAVWISLHESAGFGESRWTGLGNYRRLVTDPVFRTSLLNTVQLLVVVGACTFVLAFALTMVLREMRGRLFARNVLFFPNLVNGLVYGVMAGLLFNPDGLVNTVLRAFGVEHPPRWLAQDNVFPLIMGVMVWGATGYFTTIIMAGVDRIPPYYYEECELAGASAWQRLRHVTLPLTWDVLTVCALLWTISSVKVFELVLVFGGAKGLPPSNTWPVALYSYAEAFGGVGGAVPRYGMACASALLSLVLVAGVVLILRRLLDREPVQF